MFQETKFYLPVEAINPFLDPAVSTERYFVEYDDFSLLMTETRDPLGNTSTAENDYRVLAPRFFTDPNLNRTEAAFDALGMVVKTAVMGKTAEAVGDNLANPTTERQYDLLRWQHEQKPAFVHTIAREVHFEDNATTPLQHSFTYFDGFERAVMEKIQAEPGEVPGVTGPVDPRWVGSGRTVFNNKGNPVKRYEPFFSATKDFEDEADIVETGVTPIIHYDPLDRVIRVEFPSGVESRTEFDAWQRADFDPNDTVLASAWYAARGSPNPTDPEPSDPESRAAWLAAQHADTPTVTHLDSLSRIFLSVGHNRTNGIDTFLPTRHELDIEANVRKIIDAREIVTATQVFDVLGRRLAIASPDRGARLDVADAANKPLRSYNTRQHSRRYEYDALQRPTRIRLAVASGTEELVELTVYGEAHQQAQTRNLRGQPYQIYDGAGVLTNVRYDFKGNAIEGTRRLARTYRETPDWSALAPFSTPESVEQAAEPMLESDVFLIRSSFDALNRATTRTTHDGSVLHFEYNEASLLERIDLSLDDGTPQAVILDIEYNARGQRTRYVFANPNSAATSYETAYTYDAFTFQLARVLTSTIGDSDLLQDLRYFYDPIGNVVELHDRADPALVFGVAPVSGDNRYQYDALYRLVQATGREHPGQQGVSTQSGPFEQAPSTLPHPNDQQALLRYLETYAYDPVGNIERMAHATFLDEGGPAGPPWTQWTRRYEYSTTSNRLLRTSLPGDAEGTFSETYDYDSHGSMTRMPHLAELEADWEDRLRRVDKQGGGEVFMAYDALGGRIRKVWEHAGIVEERVYLGGSEIFRRRPAADGAPWEFERTTLHVSDDGRRVAMVETKTLENGIPLPTPEVRWRFQLDNHIGSTTYELDHDANVISYEEYHPHGSTSFHASAASAGVSAKRYRYSGKERDEETGLYYYGARYYAPWLGRWTSTDPAEFADGVNLYAYVQGNPINLIDPDGSLSWGAILGIAAAVVVGTVVTVATAGLADPLVGSVAAGIIGGVVGGAAGGAAGQIVEDVAEGKKLELGKIAKAAGIGALAGGVFSGLGAAIARGAATQTGRALLARVATSGVGQSVGRLTTRAASTAVGRGARRVGTALKEKVQVPSEKAGEALGEKLGGRFAQRAAEHRAQRQLGEQVSADIAKEVASGTKNPAKGPAHAGVRGTIDGKEQAAVTRSSSAGGTTGQGAIREPRAQAGGPPGKVLAPAPPPDVGPKAYDIKFPRERDAERKLTQYIESVTTPSSTGSVVLGASKPMCSSCVGSILQTEANRPGINILRLSPSIDFPGAGVGGAVTPSLVEPGPAPAQPTPTIPIFRHDF